MDKVYKSPFDSIGINANDVNKKLYFVYVNFSEPVTNSGREFVLYQDKALTKVAKYSDIVRAYRHGMLAVKTEDSFEENVCTSFYSLLKNIGTKDKLIRTSYFKSSFNTDILSEAIGRISFITGEDEDDDGVYMPCAIHGVFDYDEYIPENE